MRQHDGVPDAREFLDLLLQVLDPELPGILGNSHHEGQTNSLGEGMLERKIPARQFSAKSVLGPAAARRVQLGSTARSAGRVLHRGRVSSWRPRAEDF